MSTQSLFPTLVYSAPLQRSGWRGWWRGNLLMGGLSSMALLRLTFDGNKVTNEERIDMRKRIRDLIQAPDGAIMLLTDGGDGELLRLTPANSR